MTAAVHHPERGWRRFLGHAGTIVARRRGEVGAALQAVQEATSRGRFFAVGFVAYEAAPDMDPSLTTREPGASPLVWFALFRAYVPLRVRPGDGGVRRIGDAPALAWRPDLSEEDHAAGIACIKDCIARGHTYQVNYTMRLAAPWGVIPADQAGETRDRTRIPREAAPDPDRPAWSSLRLLRAMLEHQGNGYGAYLRTREWIVCSASPELFLERVGPGLVSRPMKGTASRGRWPQEDETRAELLRQSEKERAENLMIVDMVRHDLGRIAETGSVRVTRLFHTERYPALWQLTSEVTCRSRAGLSSLFEALFPAASITGAPKRRTMEIIAELEASPRGVYTGAVGVVEPSGDFCFNVGIRTAWIDRRKAQVTYGTGGGVVWDSTAAAEYQECLLKASVVTRRPLPPFELLETMRWSPAEGYRLLERHIERLRGSAAYFAFPFREDELREKLKELSHELALAPAGEGSRQERTARRTRGRSARDAPGTVRVRLLLSRLGSIRLESTPVLSGQEAGGYRVRIARQPVRSENPLLYHKTTWRTPYDRAWAEREGADDIVLWNERGEITETCIANLAVRRQGRWITPPLTCGLLPGTARAELLERGVLHEGVIAREEARKAGVLLLFNSVRGAWRARLGH